MALQALAALSPGVVGIAADVVRAIVEYAHEVPVPDRTHADTVHAVVGEHGAETCRALMHGLVTHFPPENMPVVVSTMRTLATDFAAQMPVWASAAAQALPTEAVPEADKMHWIEQMHAGPLDERIKPSLVRLYGASRKSRERAQLE